jgi:hypothetical protein
VNRRLATTILAWAAALRAGTPAPSDTDTPAHFSGRCQVALNGSKAYWTTCTSEDLRVEGQNNRFRIVIHQPKIVHPPVSRSADYLRTECTPDGHMRVSSLLIGTIEITPANEAIRAGMAAAAPAWEIRPHRVSLYTIEDGSLELLIEEPSPDFTGQYVPDFSPSAQWLADHIAALQLLSHAR